MVLASLIFIGFYFEYVQADPCYRQIINENDIEEHAYPITESKLENSKLVLSAFLNEKACRAESLWPDNFYNKDMTLGEIIYDLNVNQLIIPVTLSNIDNNVLGKNKLDWYIDNYDYIKECFLQKLSHEYQLGRASDLINKTVSAKADLRIVISNTNGDSSQIVIKWQELRLMLCKLKH